VDPCSSSGGNKREKRAVFGVLNYLVSVVRPVTSVNPGLLEQCETSAVNYHYSLGNNPEERGSHLLRDGSLKSHSVIRCLFPVGSRGRSCTDMQI
jgi:hypothetical protein